MTAIAAVMQAGTSNKKVPRKKIIKILLDSGSSGDLLFHEMEQLNISPSWLGRCQSHGTRRMGFSKQKETRLVFKLNSLNIVTAKE